MSDDFRGLGLVPPPPLRGVEANTFAHSSVAIRLPNIGRRTLEENHFPAQVSDKIVALIEEIPYTQIRLLEDSGAPDSDDWQGYLTPCLDQNWLQVPWFFAEAYFYRRILEATGYFLPGEGMGIDPFSLQKRLSLEKTQEATKILASFLSDAQPADLLNQAGWQTSGVSHFLSAALWGNQVDLSMWPISKGREPIQTDLGQQQDHLLVDSRQTVLNYIEKNKSLGRMDIIVDNAGFELVCDLCLADFLLSSSTAKKVLFHLKAHPTFVSDATLLDINRTIGFLVHHQDTSIHSLGSRLHSYIEQGRILLKDHFFWNSPLPLWEAPTLLAQEISQSDLVISKGDANYRRLLGDRHWPFTTAFTDVLAYLPVPLLALRSLKSEVITGLTPDQPEELNQKDSQWLVNVRWGIIQFHNPKESLS